MDILSKDMFYYIAKDMKIRNLINLCKTCRRINEKIYKNVDVWRYRLNKEFQNWEDFQLNKSPIDTCIFIYQLKFLKNKFNITESIYDFYNRKILDLSFKKLLKVPKEIGNLSNLEVLYLDNNYLTDIPKEIGNISCLNTLYLSNNKLKYIPKEIENLLNLEVLLLSNNDLTEIPTEIGNFPNLKSLSLFGNRLLFIPDEISNLSNLCYLSVDKTLSLSNKIINNKRIRIDFVKIRK